MTKKISFYRFLREFTLDADGNPVYPKPLPQQQEQDPEKSNGRYSVWGRFKSSYRGNPVGVFARRISASGDGYFSRKTAIDHMLHEMKINETRGLRPVEHYVVYHTGDLDFFDNVHSRLRGSLPGNYTQSGNDLNHVLLTINNGTIAGGFSTPSLLKDPNGFHIAAPTEYYPGVFYNAPHSYTHSDLENGAVLHYRNLGYPQNIAHPGTHHHDLEETAFMSGHPRKDALSKHWSMLHNDHIL